MSKLTTLDSKESVLIHKQLIQDKGWLNKIYFDFYNQIRIRLPRKGKMVEIGSGGGFIKEIIPNVITSDIIAGPGIDLVFSGTKIPFKKNTITAFILIDTFHHIKKPALTLKEMERCLIKGGKIIMIEPANTFWSRFIYKNFHEESFNSKSDWNIEGSRRLSDANIALPWIVFIRDKQKFNHLFPNLKVISYIHHSPINYLISGGLSKSQLLPTIMYSFISRFEKFLLPIAKFIGMFVTIEVRKT